MRRGFSFPAGTTLPELLVVLALAGVLVALAGIPLAGALDRQAVRSARTELAGVLAATRAAARLHGGAVARIDAAAGTVVVLSARGDSLRGGVDLAKRHGVRLEVGAQHVVEVRYDALGIGRVASRSIGIRRGRARAGVVISAYGRVRTW